MPPVRTPFDAQSTAAEVIAGVDLTGKRAVVTGGASGIGLQTARTLASAGAQVTPGCPQHRRRPARRRPPPITAVQSDYSLWSRGPESTACRPCANSASSWHPTHP
jgi:hypothetical protein